MFTLSVMVDGHTQIEQPGLSFDRLRSLLSLIEPVIPDLKRNGKVAVIVKTESGICHILGNYP